MQISEEGKKVINKIKRIKVSADKETIYNYEAGKILNLIEKQSKQLEEQINRNRKLDVENQKLFDDNFIMDRMINKMSEEIRKYWDSKDEYKNFGTKQIKEYFRKKVENG